MVSIRYTLPTNDLDKTKFSDFYKKQVTPSYQNFLSKYVLWQFKLYINLYYTTFVLLLILLFYYTIHVTGTSR